jgi:hypothetical protein
MKKEIIGKLDARSTRSGTEEVGEMLCPLVQLIENGRNKKRKKKRAMCN